MKKGGVSKDMHKVSNKNIKTDETMKNGNEEERNSEKELTMKKPTTTNPISKNEEIVHKVVTTSLINKILHEIK